jgi:hypothetical protein
MIASSDEMCDGIASVRSATKKPVGLGEHLVEPDAYGIRVIALLVAQHMRVH